MDVDKLIRNRKLSSPGLTKLRFFQKVRKTDSCWIWMGGKLPHGYGLIRAQWTGKRTMWRTHRYSWLIHNGDIPDGMCVLHKCDNTSCVNPDHLFLGSQTDNILDMQRKGRLVAPSGGKHWTRQHPENLMRGERHSRSRLTDKQVGEVREKLSTHTHQKLANEYGISTGTVWQIHHNVGRFVRSKP